MPELRSLLPRRRTSAARTTPPKEHAREEIHKRVRHLEIRARSLLREEFLGEFRSAFRGRGLDFSQIRAYLPGDGVRFIDWNVTARRGAPFIKEYVEERERSVFLLLDVSASAAFGTVGHSVRSYAVEVAGLLGFAAARSNDRVGAVAFSDRIEYVLPACKSAAHVLRLLHDLLALEPEGTGTDLGAALDYAGRLARRGSVILVLSDFLNDGWDAPLRRLGMRHDVVAISIADPREARTPSGGMITLEDSERGDLVLIDSRTAERRFTDMRQARSAGLPARLRAAGVDAVSLRTDRDYLPTLVALFRARARRP